MTSDTLLWGLIALLVLNTALVVWLLLRKAPVDAEALAHRQLLLAQLQQQGQRVAASAKLTASPTRAAVPTANS